MTRNALPTRSLNNLSRMHISGERIFKRIRLYTGLFRRIRSLRACPHLAGALSSAHTADNTARNTEVG